MELTDLLARTGGLSSMARELGLSEAQAQTGAAALLPAILGGLQKRAQPDGGDGLGDLLAQLGGGGLLDAVLSPQPTAVGPGNEVLGQIFGSKDVSRAVAQNAAGRTGLDPALLKKMLPILAMLVSGYLAKKRGAGGATAGGLGGLLGGLIAAQAGGANPRGGGLGGLAQGLDANGDGNPLDDILRQLGR